MCTYISKPVVRSPRRLFKLINKKTDEYGVTKYVSMFWGNLEYELGDTVCDPRANSPGSYAIPFGRVRHGWLHFCTSLRDARLLANRDHSQYPESLRDMRILEVQPKSDVFVGVLDGMDEKYDGVMEQAVCQQVEVLAVHTCSFPRKRKAQSNGKRKSSSSRS